MSDKNGPVDFEKFRRIKKAERAKKNNQGGVFQIPEMTEQEIQYQIKIEAIMQLFEVIEVFIRDLQKIVQPAAGKEDDEIWEFLKQKIVQLQQNFESLRLFHG